MADVCSPGHFASASAEEIGSHSDTSSRFTDHLRLASIIEQHRLIQLGETLIASRSAWLFQRDLVGTSERTTELGHAPKDDDLKVKLVVVIDFLLPLPSIS